MLLKPCSCRDLLLEHVVWTRGGRFELICPSECSPAGCFESYNEWVRLGTVRDLVILMVQSKEG